AERRSTTLISRLIFLSYADTLIDKYPAIITCNKHGEKKVKPDLNTTLPVRQTASIFKQPVTKVTNHPSNKVKTDSHKAVDQPRQLFWERKLSGLSAFEIAEELVKTMDLPRGLKGVGPLCSDKTLLSAISSALPQPCHWSAEHSCGEEPCGMAQRRSARPSWLPMTTSGRVHINLVEAGGPGPQCEEAGGTL
uniref:Methyl-CpG binding domain protein 3 n=1 Tax=Oncorhynchus tshawytscha TaxID=74940 RepID=A0A8C8JSK6_ONCTS